MPSCDPAAWLDAARQPGPSRVDEMVQSNLFSRLWEKIEMRAPYT